MTTAAFFAQRIILRTEIIGGNIASMNLRFHRDNWKTNASGDRRRWARGRCSREPHRRRAGKPHARHHRQTCTDPSKIHRAERSETQSAREMGWKELDRAARLEVGEGAEGLGMAEAHVVRCSYIWAPRGKSICQSFKTSDNVLNSQKLQRVSSPPDDASNAPHCSRSPAFPRKQRTCCAARPQTEKATRG